MNQQDRDQLRREQQTDYWPMNRALNMTDREVRLLFVPSHEPHPSKPPPTWTPRDPSGQQLREWLDAERRKQAPADAVRGRSTGKHLKQLRA
jgi:hypothetical protein